ncbi:MAG: GTPase Era [Alphaproteobacteria bacterium]
MTDHDVDPDERRCGFVSVIGLPNAGKSTLINEMVGSKVSIVSRKIQTTRTRVLGIALHKQTQMILIDTPGIFKPKKTLEKAMVTAALSSLEEADYVFHIVDAAAKNPVESNQMITKALGQQDNIILVLNKIDHLAKPALLKVAQDMNDNFPYKATFMISALEGKGVNDLAEYISAYLPKGIWMYPEDQVSDMPMRLVAAEITREKVFDQLHQEIPYSIFIETENWENFDNGSIKISQVVYVQKESQKGIVLGKGGVKIKRIGQEAREELEEMLERRVHLKIFVRVQENWAERVENYEMFGLDLPRS